MVLRVILSWAILGLHVGYVFSNSCVPGLEALQPGGTLEQMIENTFPFAKLQKPHLTKTDWEKSVRKKVTELTRTSHTTEQSVVNGILRFTREYRQRYYLDGQPKEGGAPYYGHFFTKVRGLPDFDRVSDLLKRGDKEAVHRFLHVDKLNPKLDFDVATLHFQNLGIALAHGNFAGFQFNGGHPFDPKEFDPSYGTNPFEFKVAQMLSANERFLGLGDRSVLRSCSGDSSPAGKGPDLLSVIGDETFSTFRIREAKTARVNAENINGAIEQLYSGLERLLDTKPLAKIDRVEIVIPVQRLPSMQRSLDLRPVPGEVNRFMLFNKGVSRRVFWRKYGLSRSFEITILFL